jgi:hypothetical protein
MHLNLYFAGDDQINAMYAALSLYKIKLLSILRNAVVEEEVKLASYRLVSIEDLLKQIDDLLYPAV